MVHYTMQCTCSLKDCDLGVFEGISSSKGMGCAETEDAGAYNHD